MDQSLVKPEINKYGEAQQDRPGEDSEEDLKIVPVGEVLISQQVGQGEGKDAGGQVGQHEIELAAVFHNMLSADGPGHRHLNR